MEKALAYVPRTPSGYFSRHDLTNEVRLEAASELRLTGSRQVQRQLVGARNLLVPGEHVRRPIEGLAAKPGGGETVGAVRGEDIFDCGLARRLDDGGLSGRGDR
ncbi:MAG: hypothetical protein JO188_03365 [Hyphomicrobiales bacterium]|nr:hypothetical protein [Hyphomicrobiales bacterium]